jgi:hypothetical protein
MSTFTSHYPPAFSDTYVKTTSKFSTTFEPWFTTNPLLSLTGAFNNNQWLAVNETITNQRFHIDLGSAKIIKRIYYENGHSSGSSTWIGIQNFTLWGSNEASAFAELTYGTDTNWTQLTTAQSTFDIHTGSDVADPKYIAVTNTTAYRYYAFKFADTWSTTDYMGIRRLVLQTESGTGEIDLNDKSGNGNTLTNVETLEYTGDKPFAVSTRGVVLDASTNSQYLWAADSASLSITGDISLEAWIRPETLVPGGANYLIIAKRDDGTGDGESYHLKLDSSEYLAFGWSSNGTANAMYQATDAAIYTTPGSWIHVAVTVDVSAETCILYINGSAVASTLVYDANQTSILDGDQKFLIGTLFNDGAFYADEGFNGAIDEVRVWNDIRTAEEIAANYNVRLAGNESNLAAYYPFETLGSLLQQTCNEAVLIIDTIKRKPNRTLIDTVTLVDTITQKIKARILTEITTIIDVVNKKNSRLLTDTVAFIDLIIAHRIAKVALSEIVAIVETFTRSIKRTLSDSTTIVDTIRGRISGKILTETITIVAILRNFLNGILVSLWTRVRKVTTSWTKDAKPTTSWSKEAKPTTTWTKEDKPDPYI